MRATVSVVRFQVHGAVETNHDRADVEYLNLERERIMEEQTGDKGTLDFEDQLREIDAEISGNDNKRCNVENVLTEKIMEKENKLTAKRNETPVGEASTHGPGSGLIHSGPQAGIGRTEEIEGLDEPKPHFLR